MVGNSYNSCIIGFVVFIIINIAICSFLYDIKYDKEKVANSYSNTMKDKLQIDTRDNLIKNNKV